MSETLELFLLLGALYLMECCHWVRRTTVGVVCRRGRGRVVHPPALLGHEYSGVLIGSLLPPFGTTWLLHGWPASLGPSAWAVPFPQALDPGRGPFADTRCWPYPTADQPIRLEGPTLRPAATDSLLTGSPSTARWWRSQLLALAPLSEDARTAHIHGLLAAATDPESLRARVADLERETRALSLAGHGLFLWVFLVAPLWVWRTPLVLSWPWLLAGLGVFWMAAQVLFHRAHVRWFREQPMARWGRLLHATFLPLSAIRHRDHLAQELLVGRDPLVGLGVLAGPAAAATVASGLRDLAHPLWRPKDLTAADGHTVQWFREQHAQRVREVLIAEGFPPGPEDVEAGVAPEGGATCPRCQEPWPDHLKPCGACAYQPI